jgi:hypothetical protein
VSPAALDSAIRRNECSGCPEVYAVTEAYRGASPDQRKRCADSGAI